MSTKIGDFEVVFLHKIDFPGQMVNCCLLHTIHILKAIVPAVNLTYLGTLYAHPVTRPIFRNIVGINWQYQLKPCHMVFFGKCIHIFENKAAHAFLLPPNSLVYQIWGVGNGKDSFGNN